MDENKPKAPSALPWLLVILVVAAALRALFWMDAGHLFLFQEPTGDSATYVQLSQELGTEGLSAPRGEPYQRAPLYPLFLRALDAAGLGLDGVRMVQFFLGLVGVVLLWILGGRVAGRTGAVVAALGGAIYGPLIFFEAELLSISLAVFFLELALVLWGRTRWAVVAGLLFGLSALSQPNFLVAGLLAAAASLVLPLRFGWNGRKAAVLFAAGLLIPPAATLSRNLAQSGEPVLIAVNGGVNFFIGNNPSADGTFSIPPRSGLLNRPEGLFTSARETAERDRGRPLSHAEVDRYWWLKGIDYWLGQPGRAMALTLGKVLKSLNDDELPSHYDYGYIKEKVRVLRALPTMGWLLPLGALGLILSWRSRRFPTGWLFLFFLLSIIPFFITGRYRLPLVVFLLPAAGVTVRTLWEHRHRRLYLAGLAAALAAYAVFANVPLYDTSATRAHMLNVEGMAAMQKGAIREAKDAFERAVEVNPNHAEALNNLAFVLQQQGDIQGALLTYKRAILANPLQAETYMNLEELYRKAGRNQDALRILDEFEKARGGRVQDKEAEIELRRGLNALALGDTTGARRMLGSAVDEDPDLVEGWENMAELEETEGNTAASLEAAAHAVSLNPEDHQALITYARALEESGNIPKAIDMYLRAVRAGHKDVNVYYRLGSLLVQSGRGPEGEQFLLAANERRPHPAALWALGNYYEKIGRNEDAVTAYTVLVRIKAPQAADARARLQAIGAKGRDGKN